MMRSAVLVACIAVAAQIQTPQRPPVFRAGAVLVTVDAYPRRDGRLVEGLTPADFQILEDSKPQTVEAAEFVRVEPGLSESERRDPNTSAEAWELAADPHNRVFVVYLDALHVTVDGSHNIRRPLVDTLNRIIAPNDLFGVMTPSLQPRHLSLGRRLQSIEEQLTRYWPWGERNRITRDPNDPMEDTLWGCFSMKPTATGSEPWEVVDEGAIRTLDQVLIDRRREDKTLTSLEDLVAHLAMRREARTVLMLITDGWLLYSPDRQLAEEVRHVPSAAPGVTIDQGGRLGLGKAATGTVDRSGCNNELIRLTSLDSARRLRDLLTQANRANVSVYPVTPSGLAVFDTPISERVRPADRNISLLSRDLNRVRNRVEGLRTLAENTDGLAIVNTNDLAAGMRRIVDDVSAYYLLTYYSTNTKHDGRYRRIDVKMKPPGLQIKARRGYTAPSEEAVARGKAGTSVTPSVSAAPSGPSAVDTAFGVLGRLRPSAESFTHGVAMADELVVAVEIASAQVAGRFPQGADVRVVATTAAGAAVGEGQGRIEPATRGTLVRIPLPGGGAGPWRVTTTIGTGPDRLEDRAEIRGADGKHLGDALVFRGTPAATSPLRAVADFQFRRTERVHVEWAVRAPVDRREARLLGRNGQPLAVPVTLTEPDVAGRAHIAADLNLAPLSAGDYVIELVVGSGAETERKYVAIRIL